MSIAEPDTTLEILKDIRDEIRGARNELRDEIRGVRTERLEPPRWRRGKVLLAILGAVAVAGVVMLAFRGGEQKGDARKNGVPQVAVEAAARPAPSMPVPAAAASMPDPPMPMLAATPATPAGKPASATPAAKPASLAAFHSASAAAPRRTTPRHKAPAPEAELEPAKL
jgi:hypothetical protein